MVNTFLKGRGSFFFTSAAACASIAMAIASCNTPDGVLIPVAAASSASGTGGAGDDPLRSGNAPDALWTRVFLSDSTAYFYGLDLSPAGNPVVLTKCNGQIDFGGPSSPAAGLEDFCVAKLDPSGDHIFSVAGTGTDETTAVDIAAIGEDTLVYGYFRGDLTLPGHAPLMTTMDALVRIFVARLDPTGMTTWVTIFDVSSSVFGPAVALAVAPSGDIYITGNFDEPIDFGQGPVAPTGGQDVFLVKLSPSGDMVWNRHYGVMDEYPEVAHIAVDKQGRVLLTGSFSDSADFGSGTLVTAGSDDVFIAVFQPDGSPVWSKRFGSDSSESGYRIDADDAGNIYVAGDPGHACFMLGQATVCGNKGDGDIFLAKFDPAGNPLWAKSYGDAAVQGISDMAVDGAGTIHLTGYMRGTLDFGGVLLGPVIEESQEFPCNDAFIAKLDTDGKHIWSARYGGASNDYGDYMDVDSAGNVIVAGLYSKTLNFGDGPLPLTDGDLYVTKLPPQ